MSQRSNRKQHLVSGQLQKIEIWSRDTGQQIPCFDRCHLIITWMSNIKGVHGKPRLHVSVNPLLIWSMAAMLHAPPSPSSSSRVRAHEQYRCPWQPWENQVMGFFFPIWLWGSAWRPFGPPELRYYFFFRLSFSPFSHSPVACGTDTGDKTSLVLRAFFSTMNSGEGSRDEVGDEDEKPYCHH